MACATLAAAWASRAACETAPSPRLDTAQPPRHLLQKRRPLRRCDEVKAAAARRRKSLPGRWQLCKIAPDAPFHSARPRLDHTTP